MQNKIDFHDLTIQDLFKSFYLIPDYQREYVWEEKQVTQLLGDIFDQFSNNSETEYFLGTVVVCKHKDTNKEEVIDGQQRLITLSLVLNSFRRLIKKYGDPVDHIEPLLNSVTVSSRGERLRSPILEVQYEGKEVLYDLYKLDAGQEISFSLIEGKPGKTIFDAHESIENFLQSHFIDNDSLERLKHFSGYILTNVKIIKIETPNLGSALKIFETINERGVGLDDVDLLKNRLFMQVERSDFQKLKADWNKFKKHIQGGKVSEKPLRFLRYFIMANYAVEPDEKGSKIVREDDVYDWFANNESKCNYRTNSIPFVRKLQETGSFYVSLMNNRFHSEKSLGLENISFLVGQASRQHFILLLAAKEFKPNQFDVFVKELETLLFYYAITKEPSRELEKKFSDWAQDIQKIKTDQQLNGFIASRFWNEISNRQASFDVAFNAIRFSNIQKFRLKYLLAKFTQFIEKERMGGDDLSLSVYLKKDVHIEHILPEDRDLDALASDFDGKVKDYDFYKEKIGNLTLLEKPINTSAKNKGFEEKKKVYKSSAYYLTRSISEKDSVGENTSITRTNELIESFSIWGKNSIDKRQAMLLSLVPKVWFIK